MKDKLNKVITFVKDNKYSLSAFACGAMVTAIVMTYGIGIILFVLAGGGIVHYALKKQRD